MTERERQGASGADVELLVAAEGEIAILQVQIGMAHAATLNAHQHFAAAWRWALDDGLAERLPVGGERLAVHLAHVTWLRPVTHPHHAAGRVARRERAPAQRGTKNGNFRNGNWTAEAIEERRWLRSLVCSTCLRFSAAQTHTPQKCARQGHAERWCRRQLDDAA